MIIMAALVAAVFAVASCGGLDYERIDAPASATGIDDSAPPGGITEGDDDTAGDDDDDNDDDDEPYDPLNFAVHFYDVGLGDSALFEVPGGHAILVDGGAQGSVQYKVCDDLQARGIDRLDAVVMTHPQYDHCGGLAEIFDCVDVGEVWVNGDDNTHDSYQRFLAALEEWGGPVIVKNEGDIDNFDLLYIGTYNTFGEYDDYDNNGLVQMFEFDGARVLMTADVRWEAQNAIAARYGVDLVCDVIKIPDHGLVYAETFLQELDASIAVLSVGPNEMGYPQQNVIDAYLATGLDLYRTDEHGDVHLSWIDGEFVVETDPETP